MKGEYICHSVNYGFVYRYVCSGCGAHFRETAPELSAPALCAQCYTGHNYKIASVRKRPIKRRK